MRGLDDRGQGGWRPGRQCWGERNGVNNESFSAPNSLAVRVRRHRSPVRRPHTGTWYAKARPTCEHPDWRAVLHRDDRYDGGTCAGTDCNVGSACDVQFGCTSTGSIPALPRTSALRRCRYGSTALITTSGRGRGRDQPRRQPIQHLVQQHPARRAALDADGDINIAASTCSPAAAASRTWTMCGSTPASGRAAELRHRVSANRSRAQPGVPTEHPL